MAYWRSLDVRWHQSCSWQRQCHHRAQPGNEHSPSISELCKSIMPDENLGFITSLTIAAETPAYTPSTRPAQPPVSQVWVNVAEYELICYGTSSTITATGI